ncbi:MULTISPECIES: response regulator transcription factor [Thalassospira]|jgi:two-component system response regulator TctD|uniref:response regulator transcription factor n=1 Tax=Thalassospira TaxID=168934 RepID=UPI000EECA783|nr:MULTISPECIES: response regulator transcription factor [Thalassospira]MBR9899450.1 response regulator transcription factor [Rhodospirillales bacterium]MBO6805811.1 response regulator transcription factor [Thalassospira sp.]MBO6841425.1 response regulator transcription factor [Thalassospira sp.]MBS8273539.1 DNA-binding response regulator [Thalassospira tepidiphila]HAI33268.1 DNA-binding response regulator [Thalassospira sp.]|tara:strand:+ start:816 stop:1487 length:672 start_codon:yes stop_codon:yes gene_type:complete
MRILLIEDNETLAETIMDRLHADGHAIDCEYDGELANDLLRHKQFDLVLMDVNLPGRSGFDILRSMRARGDATPVLILTARSEIDDRLIGLDGGADDYIVKPVDLRELAARCRALIRRRSGTASNQFCAGNLVFDRASKVATIDGRDIELRNREVQLLEIFIGNLQRVLTKEDLADKVYSFDEAPSMNAVEQMVTRLRKKLAGGPIILKTIRGLGYIAHIADE